MKRNLNLRPMATLAAAAALAVSAYAQRIGVTINGDPVTFSGTGPQSIQGRVMVPLRGVLERLGAYVSYNKATQSVVASRGDIDIQLKIGSRTATVNGNSVTLDVPAMIYHGSTLVPLRFMGQALGAEVRWEGATQTVNILTSDAGGVGVGSGTGQPGNSGEVNVTSFTAEPQGYARAGSTIDFTLRGTPGGNATLQIAGLTREIAMRETSAGIYTATYTVPNNAGQRINIREGSAIARLRVGNTERLIQSGTPVSIDTQPPVIRETTPAADGRVTRSRPSFTASFDDASGSGVDPESVTMTLDGRDVTRDAIASPTFLTYRPDTALPAGRHEVTISVRDRAGNTASKAYSFTVVGDSDVIRSFTHTGANNAEPGDVLRFVLLGEAGGRASFSIGNQIVDVPMREEEAGRYVGEYTVRKGDNFRNDVVTARLRTKAGETFTAEAGQGLGVQSGPAGAPTISAPTEGARIGKEDFVVRGKAERRARVRVRVTYSSPVFGVFERSGKLYDQIVDADERGNYETGSIDPNFLGADKNTVYTITVTTVGANDTESEATTLTLKR